MKSYTVHEADQMAEFIKGIRELCQVHESTVFIEDIYDLGREFNVFAEGNWKQFDVSDWV